MFISLWKECFSWSKLMMILVVLAILGIEMYLNYNLIIFGEPRIKQIAMHNIAVTVKSDRIESQLIKEDNQLVALQCYAPYCGLIKEGKYILSEVKYIILHDPEPFSKVPSRNIYYLSHICTNKKTCLDNNITNILDKKKTQLVNKARFGTFFWIFNIILIIVIPYGKEIKSETKKEIERKYGIK